MTRRILLRAGRPPHDATPNEAAIAWGSSGHFADNAGNMVFSDSVYETLRTPDTEIVCDAYVPERREVSQDEAGRVNEQYDAYVIPLANAIRYDFAIGPLVRLTQFVRQLTIPVVVVGIGGQGPIGGGVQRLGVAAGQNVREFVAAVLERSASLGARGEATFAMLEELGFSEREIEVIGCPSLFRMGREFRIDKRVPRIETDTPIAINLESKLPEAAQLYGENEARYSDLVTVMQTLPGAELLLWGREMPPEYTRGTPTSIDDPAYREGRMRFFTNPRAWREFLSEREFAFGTRIHGNIAALTAGTPAFVLTTDLRTQELVDYHGIPGAELGAAMSSGRFLAEDLYERAEFTGFNERMPENWDRYHGFLEKNGLVHIHQQGNANPEFAELLATGETAPPVTPISADDVTAIATRLRWLWQNRDADKLRPVGSYAPEFELDRTNIRSPQTKIDWINGQLRELRDQQDELQRRLVEFEARDTTVRARIARALKRNPGGRR